MNLLRILGVEQLMITAGPSQYVPPQQNMYGMPPQGMAPQGMPPQGFQQPGFYGQM